MANELQLSYPTGATLDAILLDSTGQAWNGSAFEAVVSGHWSTYAIAMAEAAGTGLYFGDMPSVAAGLYTVSVRLRAGASPSPTDTAVGGGDIDTRPSSGGSAAPAITTGIAPALDGLATVYCTDENIALRAWGDFAAICPASQKLAYGTDGVILSADRWTLSSATVDFETAGVIPGHVMLLKAGTFLSGGELFAINAVAGGEVTLRRLGHTASVGQPPAPAAGLTGVTFSVLTFGPQIDVASYDANHFFGIDPLVSTKAPAKLYDQRELQSYVVLTVLKRAYAILAKQKAEDYALKFEQVASELSDLTDRLVLRWGSGGVGEPPTTIFSARVRR